MTNSQTQVKGIGIERTGRTPNTISTYIKSFDNFKEGIEELIKVSTIIAKLFPDGTPSNHKDAAKALLKKISGNVPSLDNEEYPSYYAIDLAADRCSFRTTNFVSFGWIIKTDEAGKTTYNFRILIFTNKQGLKNVEVSLIKGDWMKYVKPDYSKGPTPMKSGVAVGTSVHVKEEAPPSYVEGTTQLKGATVTGAPVHVKDAKAHTIKR